MVFIESFTVPKEEVSLLIPSQFSEIYLRVYVKQEKHVKGTKSAFQKFIKNLGLDCQ